MCHGSPTTNPSVDTTVINKSLGFIDGNYLNLHNVTRISLIVYVLLLYYVC